MNILMRFCDWIERQVRASWTRAGLRRIEAERRRQIEVEGFTAEHDDQHFHGALYWAGLAYLLNDYSMWPLSPAWWKPGGRIRNLERAGALFMAAIDRVERNGSASLSKDGLTYLGICRTGLNEAAEKLGAELMEQQARATSEYDAPGLGGWW